MSLPVKSTVRQRALAEDLHEVTATMNREVLPTLGETRDAVNARHGRTVKVSANYDVDPLDEIIVVDASAGAVTVTLRGVTDWTRTLLVFKVDATVNAVTIAAQAGETVNGAPSVNFNAQYNGRAVTSTGTEYVTWGA